MNKASSVCYNDMLPLWFLFEKNIYFRERSPWITELDGHILTYQKGCTRERRWMNGTTLMVNKEMERRG